MGLGDEICQHIAMYLTGACDVDDLFGWLASVGPEVTPASDSAVRECWGVAFSLLSELSSGELDEDAVRDELQALIGDVEQHGRSESLMKKVSSGRAATSTHVTLSWTPAGVRRGALPSNLPMVTIFSERSGFTASPLVAR